MGLQKRLRRGVSQDVLLQAMRQKFFQGSPHFLSRMHELDEFINGTLHCTYKLEDESGNVVAYYGNTAHLAFETAQGDGYDVRWAQ